MTSSTVRLHRHRGRDSLHPVNESHAEEASATLSAHLTEIGTFARRHGRRAKRVRDLRFLERRLGRHEEVRR